jgi:hypothetical protein
MNKLIALLALLIPLPVLAEHECKAAQVRWFDAALHSRPHDPDLNNFLSLLVPQVSFGCVTVQNKVVLVVYNFSEGEPDTFLAIPAAWVTEINWLKEDEAKEEKHDVPKVQSGNPAKR